jgi:hypothetical protein
MDWINPFLYYSGWIGLNRKLITVINKSWPVQSHSTMSTLIVEFDNNVKTRWCESIHYFFLVLILVFLLIQSQQCSSLPLWLWSSRELSPTALRLFPHFFFLYYFWVVIALVEQSFNVNWGAPPLPSSKIGKHHLALKNSREKSQKTHHSLQIQQNFFIFSTWDVYKKFHLIIICLRIWIRLSSSSYYIYSNHDQLYTRQISYIFLFYYYFNILLFDLFKSIFLTLRTYFLVLFIYTRFLVLL